MLLICKVSRPTLYDYLDTLHRLMILEDQPACNTTDGDDEKLDFDTTFI